MKYNTKILKLKPSPIEEFNNYLSSIGNITYLTQGVSGLSISNFVKEKMIESILNNEGKYQPSKGKDYLLKLIASQTSKKHNCNVKEENIIITNGATEGLFLLFSALTNKDDDILISLPTYPLYYQLAEYFSCNIHYIKYDHNFNLDLNDLKKKISSKTKFILLNYPNNPTGSLLYQNQLDEIKKLCKKFNTTLIIDTVYDQIIYDKNYKPLSYDNFDNLIIVSSLSKSHALAGYRCGYIIAPSNIINLVNKLHRMINLCQPPLIFDMMYYAYLETVNIDYYQKNINLVIKTFKKLKIEYVLPKGGFYIIFSIKKYNIDSLSFCKILASKYHLGILPGVFFNLENYVRISIAQDTKLILKALRILKKAIRNFQINNTL